MHKVEDSNLLQFLLMSIRRTFNQLAPCWICLKPWHPKFHFDHRPCSTNQTQGSSVSHIHAGLLRWFPWKRAGSGPQRTLVGWSRVFGGPIIRYLGVWSPQALPSFCTSSTIAGIVIHSVSLIQWVFFGRATAFTTRSDGRTLQESSQSYSCQSINHCRFFLSITHSMNNNWQELSTNINWWIICHSTPFSINY